MSPVRANQIYLALMAMAFLFAFVLPEHWSHTVGEHIEGIFTPIAGPSRRVAAGLYQRLSKESAVDPRSKEAIATENDRLRQEVVRLQTELSRLQVLDAQSKALGDLRTLCTHFSATNDSGTRDGLVLAGSTLTGIKEGQPVLYDGGLAGRIDRAGAAGAHVRLITDNKFTVLGRFVRFNPARGTVDQVSDTRTVTGIGQGRLVIRNITRTDFDNAKLNVGDWVVLDDPDWPITVQGQRLGTLQTVTNSRESLGFVQLELAPETNLMRLTDVFVLTK
jgi:cell shape-determining protein MreC